MAAALFCDEAARAGDADLFQVSSAGTWALDGEAATPNAQLVMQKRGLSLDGHCARTVTSEILGSSDLIIVMTRHHLDSLGAEFPSARLKIHLMSELIGKQYDISDPYGSSLEDYDLCAAELKRILGFGYRRIFEWLSLSSVRNPSPNEA